MRRPIVRTSLIILLLSALVTAGPVLVRAQDGTPAADPLAGATMELLSSGALNDPADTSLLLMRMTLVPGTAIPPHRHPGPVAVQITSGIFRTHFVAGEGQLTRVSTDGTPAVPEPMTAGNSYVLKPGDAFFYNGAAHTMENAGEEPVVMLISAVFTNGQPGFIFLQGTPTPE